MGVWPPTPPSQTLCYFAVPFFNSHAVGQPAPSAANAIKTNKKQLFLPRSVAATFGETSLGRRQKKKATQLWPAALGRALARIAHISEEKWKNAPPWIYSPVILGPLNKKKTCWGKMSPQKNSQKMASAPPCILIPIWSMLGHIHADIHTYIHTYIHAFIHTRIHAYIPAHAKTWHSITEHNITLT